MSLSANRVIRSIKSLLGGESSPLDIFFDFKVDLIANKLGNGLNKGTSVSDSARYHGYLAICKLAAEREDVFRIFKGLSDYRRILEHATAQQGQDYLDIIKAEGQDLLKHFPQFQKNDEIGRPRRYNYELGVFSPTTLRYIKVLTELNSLFGDLNGLNIVEIGVGYGGQCKILSDAFVPAKYVLVDLEVVLPLVRRYLSKFEVPNTQFQSLDQLDSGARFDLAISNYAFSECAKPIQDRYIEAVLGRCERGYLTCNYISQIVYKREELFRILSSLHPTLRVIDERPLTTTPDMTPNFILVWDDTKGVAGVESAEARQ